MLDTPLHVQRRLTDGHIVPVGTLAENRAGTYFQYHSDYLAQHHSSLSPFAIYADTRVQKAPREPHYGLHGVFADSLPDGWGLYLMDRVLRRHGLQPQTVSALTRLAMIGQGGPGALIYEPAHPLAEQTQGDIDLIQLGYQAVQEFEGSESELIEQLLEAGGSGGARPKLSVVKLNNGQYSTHPEAQGQHQLIKLTSDKFHLAHHESQVESIYMTMARNLGIEVPDFALIEAGSGRYWLQQVRFDCTAQGRYHMISAAGLLDASFRQPSLDYIDLIKATRILCGVSEAKKMLKRALFHYLTVNQDDHAKNFAFLADDRGQWRLSPFYDLVYSPTPYDQHTTAFNGNEQFPDTRALELMAYQAGYADARPAHTLLDEIHAETRRFTKHAKALDLPKWLYEPIDQHIMKQWRRLA